MSRTVLLVEDHSEARIWLHKAVLAAWPDARLMMANNCQEALRQIHNLSEIGVALLDLGLPDGSGDSLISELHSYHPACQCIIATIFDDDAHLFNALSRGADGYILKDQSQQQITDMLQAIDQGQPPLSPGIARRVLASFQPKQPVIDQTPALTEREKDVLIAIAKGYKVAEAASSLGISYNTACGYLKEVYKKLGINNRAEAALEAVRLGLVRSAG